MPLTSSRERQGFDDCPFVVISGWMPAPSWFKLPSFNRFCLENQPKKCKTRPAQRLLIWNDFIIMVCTIMYFSAAAIIAESLSFFGWEFSFGFFFLHNFYLNLFGWKGFIWIYLVTQFLSYLLRNNFPPFCFPGEEKGKIHKGYHRIDSLQHNCWTR